MPDIFNAADKTDGKVGHNHGDHHLKKRGHIALSAFVVRPSKVRFETQEAQEEIILMLRRHPVTNIPWVFQCLVMALLPTILLKIVPLAFIPANFRLIGSICWYLLTFAIAFENFLSWLFNVNIITDERIIDINFPNILYKEISEAMTENVEEVNTKTAGFIGTLFNFGDVTIQTAGEKPAICFEKVPNPAQVSVVLNQQMMEEQQEKIEGRVR